MSEIASPAEVWDGPDHLRPAFVDFVFSLGDDALVLGHRLSEWCGHGPFLEEDIALANISLDLVGRADALLRLGGLVEGVGRSEDDLAYFREATEFRNTALVELPRGDFAFTMVRQFLFDAYSLPLFETLAVSAPGALAGIAAKAVKESTYHLRHSSEWVRRFGGGTEESRSRARAALDELWRYTGELVEPSSYDVGLVTAGWVPEPAKIADAWSSVVDRTLADSGLVPPKVQHYFTGARSGRHTEYLGHMLGEMQIVARSHPGAEW